MYRQSEKNLLNSNICSICPHNTANFGPLTAEMVSLVWGTPANLNGFRILPSLLRRRRSAEAKQTLHDVWPYPGLVHYIYIFEGSCPLAELCPTSSFCVLLYWQRYCAALHQRAWPGFAAWYKEWNYGTFTEGAIYIWLGGHHVGHRPTF